MLQNHFERVAEEYGIFELFTLVENQGVVLSYFTFNQAEEFIHDNGPDNENLRLDLNVKTVQGISAFYLDSDLENRNEPGVSVLAMRNDLIDGNEELRDLLLLHELCHLIVVRGIADELNIETNDCDEHVGRQIDEITNSVADRQGLFRDIDHNEEFGKILSCLIRRATSLIHARMVHLAMSKNYEPDVDQSERFKCD